MKESREVTSYGDVFWPLFFVFVDEMEFMTEEEVDKGYVFAPVIEILFVLFNHWNTQYLNQSMYQSVRQPVLVNG